MSSGFEGFGFVRVAAFGQILMVFSLRGWWVWGFYSPGPEQSEIPLAPKPYPVSD